MITCNVCSEQLDCWYDGPDVRCEGLKCANGIHATCAGLTPGHTGEWFCSEHQVGEGVGWCRICMRIGKQRRRSPVAAAAMLSEP